MTALRFVRLQRWSLALGTSMVAMVACAASAGAQCSPNPPQAGTTTTCTGVSGPITTYLATTIIVAPNAQVNAASGDAAAVRFQAPASFTSYSNLIVNGGVNGGTSPGLVFENLGTAFSMAQLSVTVAAGGSIGGTSAILLPTTSGTAVQAQLSLTNGGSLTASGGAALVAMGRNQRPFLTISNLAGGFIGGIDGNAGTITNAGTIDGGTASAIKNYATSFSAGTSISNSGTIRSSGAAATVSFSASSGIANGGTIANAGSGIAIAGSVFGVTNDAGGIISTGGTTAISSTGNMNLTNRGNIVGSVFIPTTTTGTGGAAIDSTGGGSITGNVTLGSGNDTVVADYIDGQLRTGISGTIDPGSGTNTLRVRLAASAAVDSILLPAGFQNRQFNLANDSTATLAPGFAMSGTLSFDGSGTLVNTATLSGTGRVVSHYFTDANSSTSGHAVSFVNSRTINSDLGSAANEYGVRLSNAAGFSNTGTINVTGGSVQPVGGAGAVQLSSILRTATNSGTIVADQYAIDMFDGTFLNTGTLRSNAGTALNVSTSIGSGYNVVNQGLIEGYQAGVRLNSLMANDGVIQSPLTAVLLSWNSRLYNRATGVITGSTAISPAAYGVVLSSAVINAGTINGNVNFGQSTGTSNNQFIALPGSVLNGNLVLGTGNDLFVTDLVNTGPGQFAGVTGTVSGSGSETIRYLVTADNSAILSRPAQFSTVGYHVMNNAALKLTASAPFTGPLLVSGVGSIDLAADLNAVDQSLIQSTSPGGLPDVPTVANALTIVSRGNLAASFTRYLAAGVALGAETFTNAGNLRVSSSGTEGIAIQGGKSVINSGTILVDNVVAVSGASVVTNSGTIRQVDGSTRGTGVAGAIRLVNSGTIATAGTAVALAYNSNSNNPTSLIDNSGTISSLTGTAVTALTNNFRTAQVINRAGGTITGGTGGTAMTLGSGWAVLNSGTINGDVKLFLQTYDTNASVYEGVAGTLNGNLYFGGGADFLVAQDGVTGVQGLIDGGAGIDTVVRRITTSGTVTLGGALPTNFERETVEALGADTNVVVAGAATPLTTSLGFYGDGTITNRVDVAASVSSSFPGTANLVTLNGRIDGTAGTLAFVNEAALLGGLQGVARSLTNNGTISTARSGGYAVTLGQSNSQPDVHAISVTNTGTISASGSQTTALYVSPYQSGTDGQPPSVTVVNSGTISAGSSQSSPGIQFGYQAASTAITLNGNNSIPATYSITNQDTGTISANGNSAIAISIGGVTGSKFTLNNAGLITAPTSTPTVTYPYGIPAIVAAIAADGVTSEIRNSGTITGAILLGDGDDLIENRGNITGRVSLGAGNDTFLQLAGTMNGLVDGGDGLDMLSIDTANSTNIDAGNFINFERFSQSGSGNATYNGSFNAQSFGVAGGSLTVAAGASLTSSDAVTISGSDNGEQVTNLGTISGSVSLGDGNDAVVNRGTIGGPVLLGDGDDNFTEGAGSVVAGGVDGGSGTNTYVAELAGDRAGLGQRTNFQTLGVTGQGTLTLTLDQSWQQMMLAGTNLNVALAGFSVGSVTGGDMAEQFAADGDVGRVALGGGTDLLSLRTNTLAGTYDGGTGSNTLRATAGGLVTLSGTVSNFGEIDLAGGALLLTGTLANAQGPTTLAGTDHIVSIERGANVSGGFSLGAGSNSLRIAAGATVTGVVVGGDAATPATLDLVNDGGTFALSGTFTGFVVTQAAGGGTLRIDGALTTASASFDGNLTIGAGGSLAAQTVTGSASNSTVTIAGQFSGALDLGAGNNVLRLVGTPTLSGSFAGGAGNDSIELALAGANDAPIRFGSEVTFSGFETLRTTSGVTSMAGSRSFATSIEVGAGSRLIGQAGSVLSAPQINVATGGTFGSAGTVNGNIAVAGTLSPGASPGTMTVNGNVALAAGSTGLFELSTGVNDQLVVSGTVTIAQGSTLTLTGTRPLTPGVTLDLIVANGGISGSFSTVNQPASIGGFLSQNANRLSLLGTFLTSSSFTPQVNRAIGGVNGLLVAGQASSAILAGVPQLLANGAANPQAFAQISPEPFATAMALGTENGLSLIDAVRGRTRGNAGGSGLFSFAQGLGYRYKMRGNGAEGVSGARLNATGGIAGVGYASGVASVGVFAGYGESHQRIGALGSRLNAHGLLAGLQADANFGGLQIAGLIAYDNSSAHLDRSALGDLKSNFGLHSVIGDATLRYGVPLTPGFKLQPRIGVSYIHTERGRISEAGASAYKLDLASDSHGRWFVDGGADLSGTIGPMHAFVGLGVRRRLSDDPTIANAKFQGTTSAITGLGILPERTAVLGSVGGSINLSQALSLSASYTGAFADTSRHSATIALRLAM